MVCVSSLAYSQFALARLLSMVPKRNLSGVVYRSTDNQFTEALPGNCCK